MKKILLALAICLGSLISFGTGNDAGAEDELQNKDSYYYSGDKKIKLHYDPTKVVIFDFNGTLDIEQSKAKIARKYKNLKYLRHLNPSRRDTGDIKIRVLVYDVEKPPFKADNSDSELQVMDCYYTEESLKVQPNGVISVKLREQEDIKKLEQFISNFKLRFDGFDSDPLWCYLKITSETKFNPVEVAKMLYETNEFEDVEPYFTFIPWEISYDPDVLKQWGLYNPQYPDFDISASKAWGYATGRGVRVAIIDSGVDVNHNDLKDNISKDRYDTTLGKTVKTFQKVDSHGTHCAGIVGAVRNNNLHICGVAPDAEIVPIRVDINDEHFAAHASDAIEWAWKNGVDVISLSWGCSENQRIKNAINNALTKGRNGKGCVVVTSAGNNGNGNGHISFPGNFNHDVITVGAITQWGKRLSTSSYGDYLFVCAPGYEILSTVPGDTTETASGTSTAAPHVAGVAALILERDSTLTAKKVREIIAENTTDINSDGDRVIKEFGLPWDKYYGYGLVNAFDCVRYTPRK